MQPVQRPRFYVVIHTCSDAGLVLTYIFLSAGWHFVEWQEKYAIRHDGEEVVLAPQTEYLAMPIVDVAPQVMSPPS